MELDVLVTGLKPLLSEIGPRGRVYPALLAVGDRLGMTTSDPTTQILSRVVGNQIWVIAARWGADTRLVSMRGLPRRSVSAIGLMARGTCTTAPSQTLPPRPGTRLSFHPMIEPTTHPPRGSLGSGSGLVRSSTQGAERSCRRARKGAAPEPEGSGSTRWESRLPWLPRSDERMSQLEFDESTA